MLKACYAAAISALGMLSTVLSGSTTFAEITAGQWVSVCLFSLAAGGGVYGLAGWSGPARMNGRHNNTTGRGE